MITRLLLIAYVAALALIVLWPDPVDRGLRAELIGFAAFVRGAGLIWLQYWHVEFAANVLLFVPLGVLLTLSLRRSRHARWMPPVVGFLATATVELTQLFLLPERLASLYDLLANTLGAILGWCIALLFVKDTDTAADPLEMEPDDDLDDSDVSAEALRAEGATTQQLTRRDVRAAAAQNEAAR